MSINKIVADLKKLTIAREQNFSIPLNYFLTHIAENKAARQAGKSLTKRHGFYKTLLKPIVAQRFNDDVTIGSLMLFQIQGCQFVHGFVMLPNAHLLVLYFFEDIQVGIAAITGGRDTDLYRLTVWESDDPNASTNLAPSIATIIH